MLGKILDKTARVKCPKGEPCSENCNHNKLISDVYVDDSKRNSISPSVSKRRKERQSRHVNIAKKNSLTKILSASHRRWRKSRHLVIQEPEERPKLITIKNIRESHVPKREGNMLCNWYAKKKALLQLRRARNRELDQLKSWEKWRKKEQALIEKARLEKAREEREVEFARQLHEVEQAKQLLARDTLKTKYPYKVDHKKTIESLYDYDYDDTKPDHMYSDQYQSKDVPEYIPESTNSKVSTKQKSKVKKDKKKSLHESFDDGEISSKKNREKYTEKVVVQKPLRPSLSHRFVNCFYKFCCEFYCWLTFFLIIGFTIIMLL